MKLLLINKTSIKVYRFNPSDCQIIAQRCRDRDKKWSPGLIGFFINIANDMPYAAVTIKGSDGIIESMEYVDIERDKPEFIINNDFLAYLASQESDSEIPLKEFESTFNDILLSPMKARRWEVYPDVSKLYPLEH
jgi:hypothetical protein